MLAPATEYNFPEVDVQSGLSVVSSQLSDGGDVTDDRQLTTTPQADTDFRALYEGR